MLLPMNVLAVQDTDADTDMYPHLELWSGSLRKFNQLLEVFVHSC